MNLIILEEEDLCKALESMMDLLQVLIERRYIQDKKSMLMNEFLNIVSLDQMRMDLCSIPIDIYR